ncbi:MAG: UvrD-helicase domain-containing protein [candidate division Zixibacteria bacterium]|nr:UvrD-helicase domain-containing protein [candidate division Zixibacteria bacterium]
MSGQEEITEGLNQPQTEAVTCPDGPVLVLAGAGSGKTRVLTCRVAHLLKTGRGTPQQILAVTFTNKAAGEMKSRIEKLTGIDPRAMQISTFHSFGARLLRTYGERINITRDFTIYDEDDSISLVKKCLVDLKIDSKAISPKTVRYRISNAKSAVISVAQYSKSAKTPLIEAVAKVYELYQQRLADSGALDFDDLLVGVVLLLRKDQTTREILQQRYSHILIDEFQDTNQAQYEIARTLARRHKNIFAVGDDDQSIYGWRGANIGNILNFEKDFPDCRVIFLEENYRSTQNILKAASTVIANNQLRNEKTLFSRGVPGEQLTLLISETASQEAEQIATMIENQVRTGRLHRDIAILYRTNAQSRILEESLRRRFIPYQIVGGLRFYLRKEIKDTLAYLKLLCNPKDDVSFRRVINCPKRGIGQSTITKLEMKAKQLRCSLAELITDKTNLEMLASAMAVRVEKFARLISFLGKKAKGMPLQPFFMLVAEKTGLLADLQSGNHAEAAANRIENIQELAAAAAEYQSDNSDATLGGFLEAISLYTEMDNYDRRQDAVTLMTVHAAKGLEFESVFISGLEEGLFPLARYLDNPHQLEEERRLMYVGMTRAKSKLTLSYALWRARFGGKMTMSSRFVDELPDELLDTIRPTTTSQRNRVNKNYFKEARYSSTDPYAAIRVGSIVYHPRWGEGKVVKRAGMGESTQFEVRFTYAGPKALVAKHAKLQLVR